MNKKLIIVSLLVLVIILFAFTNSDAENLTLPTDMQPIDTTVRGQRNRNPLNIKKGGSQDWQGSTGYDSQGHAIFTSIEYGTRAALIDLKGKIGRGINTIYKICDIWAEANIANYAGYVSNNSKIPQNQVIRFEKETMRKIVYYMGIWESKYKLSAEQFETAWNLANA
jgi:hypothetical protein